jgi:DNA repair exonuclease SbcCD ATPase subunit
MAYRDELEAAQARAKKLEDELEQVREDLERAEERARQPQPDGNEHPVPLVRDRIVQYRKDLAAASARIVELEAQVGKATRERSALESGEVQRLKDALAEAEARIAALDRPMPTVVEHNRSYKAGVGGGPAAGVACPLCSLAGERVEMLRVLDWKPFEGMPAVICPRCRHLHILVGA